MTKLLAALLCLLAATTAAAEEITEAQVLDLLATEKRCMQTKNIQCFASLLTEDYQSAFKDQTVGKTESLTRVRQIFMAASKILYMPQLLSMKRSPDGSSVDVELRIVEKYLFEVGPSRRVDSYSNLSNATIVLDGGSAKYKAAKFLRTE